ncbi:hypothetical protein LNP05_29345 [Klebsiella pneumoniae subsp. pneumoniae]|nr:hypothetical protein [Klebsiella pneumoniae subsp. pneumoniae]
MAWIPAQDVGGDDRQRSDELRIRASNLALSGLSGLQPFADSWRLLWANSGEPRSLAAKSICWLSISPAGDGENAFSGAVERSGVEAVETSCRGQSTSPAV